MSEELKDEALAGAEVAAEAFINQASDAIVKALLAEVAKLIPGSWDDAIIEKQLPGLQAVAKIELLKLAEQISPKV